MKIDKNITKIVVLIWFLVWINFVFRDLFGHGHLRDYIELIKRDAEGRRAYTYGDNLYEFLKFTKDTMPPGRTYKFTGIKPLSLAHRRAVYYLYPLLEKDNPDYMLDAAQFTLKKIK